MTPDKALLIGIVGGSGSGKTSIAQELIRRLGQAQVETLLLDMDEVGRQPQSPTG